MVCLNSNFWRDRLARLARRAPIELCKGFHRAIPLVKIRNGDKLMEGAFKQPFKSIIRIK
jgi:hypothetical protein